MNIEYLPGARPGAKIDLEKFKKPERPETFVDYLKSRLASHSEKINEIYGQNFLDSEGRILASGEEAEKDNNLVLKLENDWAQEKGMSLEAWRAGKEKATGTVAELALTLMLDKILAERFIVARASEYDDYCNGIDNVIIDKESGAVICGFDEVVDDMQGYYSEAKKKEKIKKISASGGAEIKYGATFVDGELKSASFENVPTFYLSLSTSELSRLAQELKKENSEVSELENKIYSRLINSLKEQALKLKGNKILNQEAEEAIKSLAEMGA
ncbi:hypothetical protein JXK06_02475 [Patescibacteria group bacterium]|nr:hypothetical protein [Patescibacteria group bacterium]